jgi:hypothetical protein
VPQNAKAAVPARAIGNAERIHRRIRCFWRARALAAPLITRTKPRHAVTSQMALTAPAPPAHTASAFCEGNRTDHETTGVSAA